MNIHGMLAALTKQPYWAINETEARALAEATANVARHYNIPEVAPKIADHINLGIALCAIYGPRLATHRVYKAGMDQAKEEANTVSEGLSYNNGSGQNIEPYMQPLNPHDIPPA